MTFMEKLEQSYRNLIAAGAFEQAEWLRRDMVRLEAIRRAGEEKRPRKPRDSPHHRSRDRRSTRATIDNI
jgi:hypothetical protein